MLGWSNDGLPLGFTESGKPITYNGTIHLVTFGGTGKGKTTQVSIPAALTWPHSYGGLDTTGELVATTGDYRRKISDDCWQVNPYRHFTEYTKGIRCVRVNPIGPHRINPNDRNHFMSRSNKVAQACVRQVIDGDAVYWYSSSTQLCQFVIMALAKHDPKNCHLGKMAEIIADDVRSHACHIMRITDNEEIKKLGRRWANPNSDQIKSMNEVIENTRTETAFLLDPAVTEVFSHSDVTFTRCKERTTSFYVVSPPSDADPRFFNTLFGSCLAELLQSHGTKRTLISADEYRSLGFAKGDEVFTTARKYQTQLWVCLQGYEQLVELHPKNAETFINNAGVVQFLSVSDLSGSRYVSDLCGTGEASAISKGMNYQPGKSQSEPSFSENINRIPRKLIMDQEVRSLASDEQILFIDGLQGRPIKAKRKPYFKTSLKHRAQPNPYYHG